MPDAAVEVASKAHSRAPRIAGHPGRAPRLRPPAFTWLLAAGILSGCAGLHPGLPADREIGQFTGQFTGQGFGQAMEQAAGQAAEPSNDSTAAIPSGSAGDLIRNGKLIFDQTPKYASAYVGAKLSCSDCHLQSGTMPMASPMIDLANLFPLYTQRAGRVISLQERIIECFVRSENGRPPGADSQTIRALTAYVEWLSRDGVKGKPYSGRGLVKLPALVGNPESGSKLYQSQCAACHGADGAGMPPALPPLWGPNSYNDGAGIDQPAKMAAFLKTNMPLNHPGSLSPQDAFDLGAFLHTMPRPAMNPAYKSY